MEHSLVQGIKEIFSDVVGKRILVIGDIMLDHYVWGKTSRLSPEAPVPLINIEKESFKAGGAANVAINLKEVGVNTSLIGAIGRDDAGNHVAEMLREAGVNCDYRFTFPHLETITKIRILAQNQHLCRLDREQAAAKYALESKLIDTYLDEKIELLDAIVLSDHGKGILEDPVISAIVTKAKEKGVFLSCDPKLNPMRDFSGMNLLVLSLAEANQISARAGENYNKLTDEEICTRIYQLWKPEHLVITLGERGMLYAEKGIFKFEQPTLGADVFDEAGVGDSIISILTAVLLTGASMQDAIYLANVVAGLAVSKMGTAVINSQEIIEHIEKISESKED